MARNAEKAREARTGRSARATERRIAHAVIHPVRLDALSILFERTASPKEIAKQLQASVGTVSFHVKELLADDAVELVRTKQRRGAIEHYYRATRRPEVSDEELRGLPRTTRRKLAALHLQAIVAEGLSSLRHGKMEVDDELNLIWMPMKLSAEGRDEVSELQAEMLGRLETIKAREEAQPRTGDDVPPVRIAAMMWFERGRPDDEPADDVLSLSEFEK